MYSFERPNRATEVLRMGGAIPKTALHHLQIRRKLHLLWSFTRAMIFVGVHVGSSDRLQDSTAELQRQSQIAWTTRSSWKCVRVYICAGMHFESASVEAVKHLLSPKQGVGNLPRSRHGIHWKNETQGHFPSSGNSVRQLRSGIVCSHSYKN